VPVNLKGDNERAFEEDAATNENKFCCVVNRKYLWLRFLRGEGTESACDVLWVWQTVGGLCDDAASFNRIFRSY